MTQPEITPNQQTREIERLQALAVKVALRVYFQTLRDYSSSVIDASVAFYTAYRQVMLGRGGSGAKPP